MSDIKLKNKIEIKGRVTLLTGLHIGGNNLGMEVGGVNATVIRNPVTGIPYIPGSSLKGKLRSLLEQKRGLWDSMTKQIEYGPSQNEREDVVKMFGNAKSDNNNIPSKIIVRDCLMRDPNLVLEKAQNFDFPFTEVKTEVVIDRIKSVALPRQLERIPAGIEFEMNLVLNIWEGTNHDLAAQKCWISCSKGIDLLHKDYLGGKGSRGSGQVRIGIQSIISSDSSLTYASPDNLNYSSAYAAPVYGH
ncbi:MAG: type III-A CRISPR-associated RAMP protein Csm3 [Saprospirales bacterium]|nr:type III-A CRISPR-associated RAMP protein Csm3 [Saprospirales bacterium]